MKKIVISFCLSTYFCLLFGQSPKNSAYVFDSAKRIIKESHSPECFFTTYDYDKDGNIILQTEKYFFINNSVQNLLCPTDSFGSITLIPITTGLTFLWSTGVTGIVLDSVPAGHYDVTITETATGNTCSQGFDITNISSAGIASVTTQSVSCNNGNDGSAFVAIQGGWGQYTYSWSNGDTTDTVTNLSTGNYSVVITDLISTCSQHLSFNISEPPQFISGISSTPPTCLGSVNGSASVGVLGNPSTYSFLWSNSQTLQAATNLDSGMYTVTVTDSLGCIEIDTVHVGSALPLITSITPSNVSCNGYSNGSAIVNVNGIAANFTFQWSNGQTTQTATVLQALTYTVIVSDTSGCHDTSAITITQPLPINTTSSIINVLCNGDATGQVIFHSNGGVPTYLFSLDGVSFSSDSVFSNQSAGIYQSIILDSHNCPDTITTIISQPDSLLLNGSMQNVTCYGAIDGSITLGTLGGVPPYQYWLDTGSPQSSPSFSNLSGGTYIAHVKDSNNCITNLSVTITQPANFILGFTISNVSCFGGSNGSATASILGNESSYQSISWSNGQNGISDTNLVVGTYFFFATDSTGCALTDTVTISEPSQLSVSVTPTIVSCDSLNNGTVTGQGSGGVFPYQFSLDGTSYFSNPFFQNLSVGPDTMYILDSNNCSMMIPFIIGQDSPQNDLAIVTSGDSLLTSPYSPLNVWYQVGSAIPIDTSDQFICTQYGLYYVIGIDQNGCHATSDTVSACLILSSNTSDPKDAVSIYPNPNNGIFTINFSDGLNSTFRLTIFDLIGKKVLEQDITIGNTSRTEEMNLTSLAKAHYTIQVKSEKVNYISKLIIN